jgi:hypothetical protein
MSSWNSPETLSRAACPASMTRPQIGAGLADTRVQFVSAPG